MANIYSLEQINERLKDRKVSVIAEKTGLSRQEIYSVMQGRNISFSTYEKLVHYLFPDERWAAAALSYGSFGVYNGWYSSKEDAEDCVKTMNDRLPHIKWELVKKSDRNAWIYWKDFDMELYNDFLNAKE